jgi:nicotinamide-nucleotide amidase
MIMELEHLSATVGTTLKSHGLKLATAESCTGGSLSYWITSIAGSSNWFERGFVTYSNEAKIELLNVKPSTLKQFGAVSKETAIEMAEGALNASHADVAISVTGVAGPDGGTPDKPIGTVWIGIAQKSKPTETFLLQLSGNRKSVREQTIALTFEALLKIV